MNDNLLNRIWCSKHNATDLPTELTEQEKADFVQMIGSGCRQPTKQRLARMVELPLSLWGDYGIYSRVVFKNGTEYICGQSWTDEMRTLRECLIK